MTSEDLPERKEKSKLTLKEISKPINVVQTNLGHVTYDCRGNNQKLDMPSKVSERVCPITVAMIWLSGRVKFTPTKITLDGRESGINDVMRETNRLRALANETQIDYNPEWVVNSKELEVTFCRPGYAHGSVGTQYVRPKYKGKRNDA